MATPTTRSRLLPPQSRRSYRLDMEAPTLLLLLGLMVATGVVLFYLGMVTGMAMREPVAPVVVTAPAEPVKEQRTPAAENLSFNKALEEQKAPLEALQVKEGQATQRTEELLSRARQELEMEEGATAAKPKSPVRTPAAPTRPVASERTPVAPMASATQAPPRESGLFTVQVFSSQSKERAQELVTRLKQQGYAAYLSSFESSGRQIWYRVRVGKTSREEADAMANKLINEENLKSTQVLKL